MQARIDLPGPEAMTDAMRAVRDSILTTRGNIDGPFLAWMHSPALADRAEKLGAFCRYDTGLDRRAIELLILMVAARFRCNGEWLIHAPIALEAGLSAGAVQEIRLSRKPELEDARLARLHRLASELLWADRISSETFADAAELIETTVLVEAVAVLGYYSLVAMTLNAFEMTIAADGPQPFD